MMRINDHEEAAAAGENRSLVIEDLGSAAKSAAALANLSGFNPQWFMERDWPQILDAHASGGGGLIAQFVQLAHGIVKNGGDNSTMAVPGRPAVALPKSKTTAVMLSGRISVKLQVHAVGIVLPTREAIILLDGIVSGH
jgi:hypothetical protein